MSKRRLFCFAALILTLSGFRVYSSAQSVIEDYLRAGYSDHLLPMFKAQSSRQDDLVSSNLVISQVYGGAGCGTANCSTYQNDYIEIYNRGTTPVNVNGWSVQYAAAIGSVWQVTSLTNVSIPPGHYYLVGQSFSANGSNPIPTPDATGTIAMSATTAKVALVNTTTALSGPCPLSASIIDFVGYGLTANCNEGGFNAPAPSTTTAILRLGQGSVDTDDNSADFSTGSPNPRNSSTPGVGGTLQFSAPTYTVGEAGPTATITATRTGGSGAVGVTYATSNGTATGGASCTPDVDHVSATNTLLWTDGDSAPKTFEVAICGDTTDEPDETVNLTLSSPTGGASLGVQSTATLTITDDDPVPALSVNDVSQVEGEAPFFKFTISLSNPSSQPVTFQWFTSDGTATTADFDYFANNGTITIPAGGTSTNVFVSTGSDTKFENDETFRVNVFPLTNATVARSPGIGTIVNDDAPPTLSINDVSVTEGNSGTTTLTFTITLSGLSGRVTTFNWATANGTATTANNDYVAASGFEVMFPDTTLKSISVTVNSDTTVEPDETFFINLSGGSGYDPAGSDLQGQGTILNDDAPPPTLQFSSATFSGPENSFATITVSRIGSTSGTSTVSFATSNGSATAGVCNLNSGQDYVSNAGTLIFGPSVTSRTINVSLCSDRFSENPAETINLALSSPTGATLGSQSTAVLSVLDAASEFIASGGIVLPGGVRSSQMTVFGYSGNIGSARVTLNGLDTSAADNIDVLLVDPSGTRKYVLMGDAGGGAAVVDGVLTFEDVAQVHLPENSAITNGQNYKPTVCATPVSTFDGGAPAGPYSEPGCTTPGATLNSTFSGFNPNGIWTLYVRDDNGGEGLVGGFTNFDSWGIQFLTPTAASVSLSGRVLTASGMGIPNARMTISGGNLPEPITVRASSFGYYHFDGLQVGLTYIVTVESRRYAFAVPSRVVTLHDEVSEFDFIAESLE